MPNGASYVITQDFESDEYSTALNKAVSWVTLQGGGISLDTIVGDHSMVTIYYTMTQRTEVQRPSTGSLTVIGPGTNPGEVAA